MKKVIIILLTAVLVIGGIFFIGIQSGHFSADKPASAVQSDTLSVTVSVRCDTVKQYAGENPAIPSDGVLAAACTETLAPGSTAYDLLLVTAKKNGFTFTNAGKAADGSDAYICAVNGLNAGDYGECSGWLFYVNGSMATVGCGAYELKEGDCVEWLYSCNFGEDLQKPAAAG